MGTDIYMSWDGQTKAEEKKQYTGYSIKAGNAGYLRASIGMEKENAILREIFPSDIWEHSCEGDGKGMPYDFKQGWAVLQLMAKKYLASCLFGIPIKKNGAQVKNEQWVKSLREQLAGNFDKVSVSTNDELPDCVMWLMSLYEFFSLGIEKQEKKLNPKVMISW